MGKGPRRSGMRAGASPGGRPPGDPRARPRHAGQERAELRVTGSRRPMGTRAVLLAQ